MSTIFNRSVYLVLSLFLAHGAFGCSTVQDVAGQTGEEVGGETAEKAADEATDSAEKAATGDTESASSDAETAGMSRKGENIIGNVERVREKCPLSPPPFEREGAQSTIDQCEMKHKRVKEQLAEDVPAKDRAHPKYADAKKWVGDLGKQIKKWKEMEKKREAQNEKERKRTEAYSEARKEHQSILFTLWKVKQDDFRPETAGKVLKGDVERAKKLDAFAEKCDGKFKDVDTYYGKDDYEHPSNTCELAKNWETYFQTYFDASIQEAIDDQSRELKRAVDNLEESGSLYGYTQAKLEDPAAVKKELVAEFEPAYEAFGKELPAEKFDAIVEAAEGYETALKTAADENRWPDSAKHKDGEVETAIQNAVSSAGQSFVAYGLTHDNWSVRKNEADYPVKKLRDFYVMTKADGEDFCRIYKSTAVSEYTGSGYTKPSANVGDKTHQFRVSRCK